MRSIWRKGLAFVFAFTSTALAQTTTRVSVDSAGRQGTLTSAYPAISADGRWVAFASTAPDLVAGDTNAAADVFLHDRLTHATTRIVASASGTEGDGPSAGDFRLGDSGPSISANGRFIAFHSGATNLVPDDVNGQWDVFVHDRDAGTNVRVSVSSSGVPADDRSYYPAISADGRFVAFVSYASNLVAGDTNGVADVFVRDRDSDGNGRFDEIGGVETRRASVSSTGVEADARSVPHTRWLVWPRIAISANGRFVAFQSEATNLVAGDTYYSTNVFAHDLRSGETERVSVDSSGASLDFDCGDASLSADGRYVVFGSHVSLAPPIPGELMLGYLFLRDRATGVTTSIQRNSAGQLGDGFASGGVVSGDGRFVAFASASGNLVPNDTNRDADVFRRDRQTGEIIRVSVADGDVEGSGLGATAFGIAMTPDASAVAFGSSFPNLVSDDTNGWPDVFVRAFGPALMAVTPQDGAVEGGDAVRLSLSRFSGDPSASVTFGGREATVLHASADQLLVQTPPGDGTVDVFVTTSFGVTGLPSAFTFAAPRERLARWGHANLAAGLREDVLLVNATTGDSRTRELSIGVGVPISIVLLSPSSRSTSSFAFYAWPGAPSTATLSRQPGGIGLAVFPTPLTPGRSPQPVAIANAWDPRLGGATFPSTHAPAIVLRRTRGITRPLTITLQSIIQDDASLSPAHASLTNAIILHVVSGS
ncbi:MAG: PD40 domain-containing protein [Planctomycetes bacterium]|nr:PD40 domain-containing protein [Planctomycetota bacterium]MBI3846375.1 PD40 domain-containing protein [Planctomycetota bacterium]